jgi:hypothetical protein
MVFDPIIADYYFPQIQWSADGKPGRGYYVGCSVDAFLTGAIGLSSLKAVKAQKLGPLPPSTGLSAKNY